MTIQRLENVGIVVDDLPAVTAFFTGLGLTVAGETTVTGEWVDRVVGLTGVRCRITVLATRDGRGCLELMRFDSPTAQPGVGADAPAHTLGVRRLAFQVDDVAGAVAGLRGHGVELLGEIVEYEDRYRLCYVRGPEGILVMLAQPLEPTRPAGEHSRG